MLVTMSVQLSVAVAMPVLVGAVLASQFTVTLTGHVIAGLVVSCTVTACWQLLLFPQLSTAVHILVIV
jgi:hypothetical protein